MWWRTIIDIWWSYFMSLYLLDVVNEFYVDQHREARHHRASSCFIGRSFFCPILVDFRHMFLVWFNYDYAPSSLRSRKALSLGQHEIYGKDIKYEKQNIKNTKCSFGKYRRILLYFDKLKFASKMWRALNNERIGYCCILCNKFNNFMLRVLFICQLLVVRPILFAFDEWLI